MLVAAALSSNSRALWYMTRGFGLVALVLLTLTLVLGLTQAVRYGRPGLPRFVISALHRNVPLLAVVILAIHVATAVADSFVPISPVDVFVPFLSKYRPLWLGLGALALDLLVALVVTSLLRERLGHRAWRAVHWAAYACWPLAVVHGLGTGSDTKLGWVLALNIACVAAVLVALWWRLASPWTLARGARRGAALAASFALPVGLGVWVVTGPLHPGWARRAGTPAALLGAAGASTPAGATRPGAAAGSRAASGLALPLTATFSGTQSQGGPNGNGLVSITLSGRFAGRQEGQLTIVLTGMPSEGGGVQLTGSTVTMGPLSQPGEYQGHVTALDGPIVQASLADSAGDPLSAVIRLQLSGESNAISGTIEATR